MKLGETDLYKQAIAALSNLKEAGAGSEDLKAIAQFLLYAHDSATAESRFPYVGDRSDPRDRAIVEAYNDAWTRFVSGDDD
ncbi:MAG: hypothetical protein F6J95_027755 [Leptolyngbya sp. SIO1E4]|nr:hypothetical protein [Leptolyngbya sp. SIO1E4]